MGQRLAVVAAANYARPAMIQAWDVLDRTPVGRRISMNDDFIFGAVMVARFATQPCIVFSNYSGVVRLRSIADSSIQHDLHCHRPLWCRGIAAAEYDGDKVVMAGSHDDCVIDIWNLNSGEQYQIDVGSSILALAAGPNRTLAVGTKDGVALLQFARDA
jgi:hypothetical protein